MIPSHRSNSHLLSIYTRMCASIHVPLLSLRNLPVSRVRVHVCAYRVHARPAVEIPELTTIARQRLQMACQVTNVTPAPIMPGHVLQGHDHVSLKRTIIPASDDSDIRNAPATPTQKDQGYMIRDRIPRACHQEPVCVNECSFDSTSPQSHISSLELSNTFNAGTNISREESIQDTFKITVGVFV